MVDDCRVESRKEHNFAGTDCVQSSVLHAKLRAALACVEKRPLPISAAAAPRCYPSQQQHNAIEYNRRKPYSRHFSNDLIY